MVEVRSDAKRKRLLLTISGANDAKDTSEGAAKVLAAARALGPGFDLVNDISTMKVAGDDVAAIISRTQAELTKLAPRRVVRVVGKAAMASLMMSRTAREAHVTYGVQTVATLAEAEALLDQK